MYALEVGTPQWVSAPQWEILDPPLKTVKNQHKVVRNREHVWGTYRLESNWLAYKKECNIYNRLLKFKKQQVISKKVKELRGDTKGLYKLTCNLTSQSTVNPFRKAESDEVLANEFADYFIEKIDKIRDKLNIKPTYQPTKSTIPRLRKFRLMTQAEVECVINSIHSKSCELHLMPTPPTQNAYD